MRTRERGTTTSGADRTVSVIITNPNPTAETWKGISINANSNRVYSWEYAPWFVSNKSKITDSFGPRNAYRPVQHVQSAGELSESKSREYTVVSDLGRTLRLNVLNQGFSRQINQAPDPGWPTAQAVNSINLRSPRRIFDGGLFLGELTEFKEGVLSLAELYRLFQQATYGQGAPGTAVRLLLRELDKRYKYRKLADLLRKDAAAIVHGDLAWKFFIKPFFNDMMNLASGLSTLDDLISKLTNPKPFVMRGIGRSETSVGSSPSNAVAFLREFHIRRKTVVAWVLAKYRSPSPGILAKRLRYMLGLDIIRPSTAWALFPRSFVIDWFVDVSSWLRGLESYSRAHVWEYDVLVTAMSQKDESEFQCTCIAGEGYALAGKLPETVTVETRSSSKTYTRSIASFSVDNPGEVLPRLRLPDFGKVFTLIEMIVTGSKFGSLK